MPKTALESWFDVFSAIHDHARNLSHLTELDAVKFAQQKPAEVLPDSNLRQNMSFFLDTHFHQRVPDSTYDDARSFREFVEALVGSRDRMLRAVLYSVAVKHKPDVGALSQGQFGAEKPDAVMPSPDSRGEAFERIDAATPTSFFPSTDANQKRFQELFAKSATMDKVGESSLL